MHVAFHPPVPQGVVGDDFTRCLACMGLCEGDLDRELVTVEEFEDINAFAA